MARMLNQEETAKLDAMEQTDCKNCPLCGNCSARPYVDMSSKAIIDRMSFGCDLSKNYHWEIVYGYRRDSKFGRWAVDWEKGLKRGTTFDEFYGGAVVD